MPLRLALLLLVAVLETAPALAQTRGAGLALPGTVTRLSFAAYAAGLHVAQFDATADFADRAYRIDTHMRATGLLGTLFPTEFTSFAEGGWLSGRAAPRRYASWGNSRGKFRRTIVDYPSGQPTLTELIPADHDDRETIPAGSERDSVDTLSALAFLVRRVAESGGCDGAARLYDGYRVMEITSRTAGREILPPDDRSIFAGPALRCDLEGRQLAGFLKDDSQTDRTRHNLGQTWLATTTPGHPALPVKVTFETRFFGNITAYLTAAGAR